MTIDKAQILLDDEPIGVVNVEDESIRMYTVFAKKYGESELQLLINLNASKFRV